MNKTTVHALKSCIVLLLASSIAEAGRVITSPPSRCGNPKADAAFKIHLPIKRATKEIRYKYDKDFLPPETKIQDVAKSDGTIFLFRTISEKYMLGKIGIFAENEGSVSTSLNPHIADEWYDSSRDDQTRVLVLVQNLVEDDLTSKRNFSDGHSENGHNFCYASILATTTVANLEYKKGFSFNEILVGLDKQNIEVSIPKAEFLRIVGSFGSESFTPEALYLKIRSSSKVEYLKKDRKIKHSGTMEPDASGPRLSAEEENAKEAK